MNLRIDTAGHLVRAFARLEFTLLRVPQFIDGRPGKFAKVHWKNVASALSTLTNDEFLNAVPERARNKMLGGNRDRPKRLLVRVPDGGDRFVEFDFAPLPEDDAAALLDATKRVRNNLFHGGKEDPRQQPYEGDDQEWCDAALDVLQVLLGLPWQQMGHTLDS